MPRRKLCRAAACPRKIPDDALFCNVHLALLPPQFLDPIADNREAPAGVAASVSRRVVAGARNAVRFIAKKEGRATALAVAERVGVTQQGQGSNPGINGLPAWKRDQFETERLTDI